MSVRTNAIQICDRCEKPFNEKHLKSGDTIPVFKQKGLVVTLTSGQSTDSEPKYSVLFSFDDLCDDCRNAVDNLLEKIQLETKPAKKRRSAKKRTPKSKQKPEVVEYTETEAPETGVTDNVEETTDSSTEESPPEESQEDTTQEDTTSEDTPPESSEPASEETPQEASGSDESKGNGDSSESKNDEGLVTDPETGDVYDIHTGEVVTKGNNGESEKHPF